MLHHLGEEEGVYTFKQQQQSAQDPASPYPHAPPTLPPPSKCLHTCLHPVLCRHTNTDTHFFPLSSLSLRISFSPNTMYLSMHMTRC